MTNSTTEHHTPIRPFPLKTTTWYSGVLESLQSEKIISTTTNLRNASPQITATMSITPTITPLRNTPPHTVIARTAATRVEAYVVRPAVTSVMWRLQPAKYIRRVTKETEWRRLLPWFRHRDRRHHHFIKVQFLLRRTAA